jgi:hypothetical protein
VTAIDTLQDLPLDAARCIFEFAYLPAHYTDPERLDSLKPAALEGLELPVASVSRALAKTVDLPDLDGLDTAQTSHRVALLPHQALRELAWWLGLGCSSAALRKLVLREDLQALQDHVHSADWDWVFSLSNASPPLTMSMEATLQQRAVAEWPQQIWHSGWDALLRLCLGLPRSIGQRLWLKLPAHLPDVFAFATQAPDETELQVLTQHVTQTYTAWVRQWDPQWDEQWSAGPGGVSS